ncbi:inner membrane component of a tripartite multidrug resistance system [Kluyvera georgiana ATCC 51603]|uniref:Inner membrane component of a tripartite multidrug resistance system n=1 Tax=Kluyvera georgiana ATCC 51603 TaxID=1354264 RepID=A0A1B7JSU4_9ENTR|nr:inner membrane component of a tripartite multidrug resistance system [Kluyvera georgiana ATCC 51603]
MESTQKNTSRRKLPALVLVLLTLIVLIFVIWRIDSKPTTDDAYVSADTIDVVPEVSGRIVELAVTDNQQVKQGDLLFRIDPRPYEASLAKAEASLAALDKQIMLTQRSVDAQKFAAGSVEATVAKARAAAKQASDTLKRTEPLLAQGLSPPKTLTAPERRSARAKPISTPYYSRHSRPPARSAASMRWLRSALPSKPILR